MAEISIKFISDQLFEVQQLASGFLNDQELLNEFLLGAVPITPQAILVEPDKGRPTEEEPVGAIPAAEYKLSMVIKILIEARKQQDRLISATSGHKD